MESLALEVKDNNLGFEIRSPFSYAQYIQIMLDDGRSGIECAWLNIIETKRRQGIATRMHVRAEEYSGLILHSGKAQFKASVELWGQPNRPFGQDPLDPEHLLCRDHSVVGKIVFDPNL
jgi:hypothetical protein